MMTSPVPDVVSELRARLSVLQSGSDAALSTAPDTALDTDDRSVVGTDVDPGPDGAAGPVDGSRTAEERAEETQARNICLRLLADSARPRANLAQKLTQRGIGPAVIERVLDRFTEVGLIDDQAYAEAYVRTKHQERSLSRRALTSELRRKGLDDAVVETAAETVDPAAEEVAATRLIEKRAPAAAAAGPEAARRRLLALLDRRGYPAEMSIRVVDAVLARQDE